MLYEKKMLILSGDGKGVVLIEKSAHGVKFTLRTFDMPHCGSLKAGIVTKSAVFVRDLPNKDNPAAVFMLENAELDALHFAVFDDVLRLYGSTCKRMWESNLMDLLLKHDRRAPILDGVPHAPLPPIAKQPQELPMPDGSGIPQTRIAVYGDDALAENDFYTRIDFSQRMPTVDGFLDTPRVLDELAPRIQPPNARISETEDIAELSVMSDVEEAGSEDPTSVDPRVTESADLSSDRDADVIAEGSEAEDSDANTYVEEAVDSVVSESTATETFGNTVFDATSDVSISSAGDTPVHVVGDSTETSVNAAVAAAEFASGEAVAAEMPWELTARWIKKRGGRELDVKRTRVRALPACEKLKHLRATEFFERARRDIDILFASARRDDSLFGLLDGVEWVKVEVDGNTVSVGRGGNAFLCYAVAGKYERIPPLGDEAQWLPLDRNVPTGKGYWVIFQNLATGEIIK